MPTDRGTAGAGGDQPRAESAALVQAGFPLPVVEVISVVIRASWSLGGQSGQRRVAEPGQAGLGWPNGPGSVLTYPQASGRRV